MLICIYDYILYCNYTCVSVFYVYICIYTFKEKQFANEKKVSE